MSANEPTANPVLDDADLELVRARLAMHRAAGDDTITVDVHLLGRLVATCDTRRRATAGAPVRLIYDARSGVSTVQRITGSDDPGRTPAEMQHELSMATSVLRGVRRDLDRWLEDYTVAVVAP